MATLLRTSHVLLSSKPCAYLRFVHARAFSKQTGKGRKDLLLVSDHGEVRVLKMNNPKRLNAWTESMMKELDTAITAAKNDNSIKALVLTGTGRYYCAGVDLSSILKPMLPRTLHNTIKTKNESLFNLFLDFPKPLVVGVNGHAVGASVTSAALVDSIVAVEDATFSTPFSALGICPEGGSSVNFERRMGKESANRMLGPEGWKPNAHDWQSLGLVQEVVRNIEEQASEDDEARRKIEKVLVEKSVEVAKQCISHGKRMSKEEIAELKQVNARESEELATCFLAKPFLEAQYKFAEKKGRKDVARLFYTLSITRPFWSLLL